MLKYLWKTKSETLSESVPPGATCFTYHLNTGIQTLLCAFLIVAFVEAISLHVLLSFLNHWLAIAATLATVFFALQVIAQVRAVGMRPQFYHHDTLTLRNGAFDIATVPISEIEHVELTSKDVEKNDGNLKPLNITFPAGHNIVMKLKKPITATILNRTKRDFDVALLAIDNAQQFKLLFDREVDIHQ